MLDVGSKVLLGCNEGFMTANGLNVKEIAECGHLGAFTSTCFPVTCQAVGTSGITVPGAYKSFDTGSKEIIDIFCDFDIGSNLGYTYISKDTLRHVTSLSSHYNRPDHVNIRHYKTNNNGQYSSNMTVLSRHQEQYPNVSVFLSECPDFWVPTSIEEPYIYIGFVPDSFGDHNQTRQGYACNGVDYDFVNCDGNANNYFVIYENRDSSIWKKPCCEEAKIAISWQTCGTLVDSSRNLPDGYFFDTYEIHMGGCGFLAQSNVANVVGVAFGLPFDYQ